jgi:hypothetical protein
VLPPEQLQAETLTLAHRLAGREPVVIRELKRMIYDAACKPFNRVLRMEFGSTARTMSTERATRDLERYDAELARFDAPSDRQILDAWEQILATGPGREVANRAMAAPAGGASGPPASRPRS